jgi:CRISPR system Cascade subunit CasB
VEKQQQKKPWQQLTPGEAKALMKWWQSMYLSRTELQTKNIAQAPSGQRAHLRRAPSPEAAMLTAGYRNLWLSLPEESSTIDGALRMLAWACIAGLTAEVRTHKEINLATQAGSCQAEGKPIVSELRFQQLQGAKNEVEFMRRLRRMIKQFQGQLSVTALADDILCWFIEHYQHTFPSAEKRIAVRWAMDYYRAFGVTH